MPAPLVEIQIDQQKLNEVKRALARIPNGLPKAVSRSINKTLQSAKTQAVRAFNKKIGVKQKDYRKKIILDRASYTRWWGKLKFYGGKRIPLINFSTRQIKGGVSYKIEKDGSRKTAAGAFIQTMPKSGQDGVFKRLGVARLPIIELFGPSIGSIFRNAPETIKGLEADAAKNLIKNIDYQIEVLLKRAG